MREGPEDFLLSSKARYQNSQDEEDAAELFFAIRNMLNHGLDVIWDDTITKAMEELKKPNETSRRSMEAAVTRVKPKVKPESIPKVEPKPPEESKPLPPTPLEIQGPIRYVDRYRIGPWLFTQQTRTLPGGVTEDGTPEKGQDIAFMESLMIGGREATKSDSPVIPSRYFDIQSHMYYIDNYGNRVNFTMKDLDPSIWLEGPEGWGGDEKSVKEWEEDPLKWLRDHADENVPTQSGGNKGIKFRDYLRPLIGRPEYTGERRFEHGDNTTDFRSEKGRELIPHKSLNSLDPIQALHFFSDSPVLENSASKFHSEFLNPDSPHHVRSVEAAIKKKDESLKGMMGVNWGQDGHETHHQDMRAINSQGDVAGDDLSPSYTFNKMYEDYYHGWLKRNEFRLRKDMNDKDKRTLFSHWYDLEYDIGQGHDDYIAQKLLRADKRMRKRYNRTNILIDPEFQHLRDDKSSHHRVGLIPQLLGLQLASPEHRMYAIADLFSYFKQHEEGGHHPIDDPIEDRKQDAADNAGGLRIDELIDHMYSALGKNMVAIANNVMGHPLDPEGSHIPPYFDKHSRVKQSIIREGLELAHLSPLSPEFKRERGNKSGYDTPTGGRTSQKSMAQVMKVLDLLDEVGVPKGWNIDNPDIMEEFDRVVLPYLDNKFKNSGRDRFENWFHTDPKAKLRGRSREYQLAMAHNNWSLGARVEGETSEPHEITENHDMSPSWLWHHSFPKTGYNLYGPDIAEILYGVIPCLGEKVKNSEMILFDSKDTRPPPFDKEKSNEHPDNYDYTEWLKGIGNGPAPESWSNDSSIPFTEKGGMSGLAMEIDAYLRGVKLENCPIMGEVYKRLYGDLPLNPHKGDFVSRLLKGRLGEVYGEHEEATMAEDSPERARQIGMTEMKDVTGESAVGERSSGYGVRVAGPSEVTRRKEAEIAGAPDTLPISTVENYPLGRRPLNERILRMILPIAGAKDAFFLREALQMGLKEPAKELLEALRKKWGGTAVAKNEMEDRLLTMDEAVNRRTDEMAQMVDRATILRGSSGGVVFPYHNRGLIMPADTLRMIELGQMYPGLVNQSNHDGYRDSEMGHNRGSAILDQLGRSGVTENRGLTAAMLGLLSSALMGGGSAEPWSFEHRGNEKALVVDHPGQWGDEFMGDLANWIREQPHPHIEGEEIGNQLGGWENEDWRNRVADKRFIYPVDKHVNDAGKEEYRLSFKKAGGKHGLQFKVPDLDVYSPYPEKSLGDPLKFPHPFSIQNHLQDIVGSRGIYPAWAAPSGGEQHIQSMPKPWMVIPEKSVINYNGQDYVVSEHPSVLKDEFSNYLSNYDKTQGNKQHKDLILGLRREARNMAPRMEGGWLKSDKQRGWMMTMEMLTRAIGTGHQAAKATLPFIMAHLASNHTPDIEQGNQSETQWKLDDFTEKYLRQHDGDNSEEAQRKYATLCHLYELAWDYADKHGPKRRASFLEQLVKQGHDFTDEQKKAFLDPDLNVNSVFGHKEFVMPEHGMDTNHPFYQAFHDGIGQNVEGLNLLRAFVDKRYGDNEQYEGLIDAIEGIMNQHFTWGSESVGQPGLSPEGWKTKSGQPISFNLKKLFETSQREHDKAMYQANHYEKGLGAGDDPLWYIPESDAPFSESHPEYKTKSVERAKRGSRAQMSLNTRNILDVVGDEHDSDYSIEDHRTLNQFVVAMGPVIKDLVNELDKVNYLPEHASHQRFDKNDPQDVMREYCRLLFLRGRINPKYQPQPWSYRSSGVKQIGDDSEPGAINLNRTRLPNLSSVHAHDSFHQSEIMPFTMDVTNHIPDLHTRGSPTPPWDVGVSGEYHDDFQDPTRDRRLDNPELREGRRDTAIATPYRTVDPSILNSAFGQRLAIAGDNSNIGASLQHTEDDEVRYSLDVLTDVDLLLKEEERDKGKPAPVKAMHRIFDLDDLEYLRGFSDDWVVTSWPAGTRVIVEKKGKKVKARDAEGKSVTLPNEIKTGVKDAHDKDFLIDAIWDEDTLCIVDILECEDDDLCNKPTKDRVRHLRAHFESTEKVSTPAPVNTKRVDGEGLKRAVKDLMKEPDVKQVLLRDAESTYMRGEMRHPKWVLLTPDHQIDVLILSSSGVDNHLIGVGPLYEQDAKAIGNRAVRYDGDYYMDVGTVSRSGLEEGMYITVKTSGISHSARRNYSVYRLNAPRYLRESESGATDSVETLEILRHRQEGNVPHKVRIKKGRIHIDVPTGHVVYETEMSGNAFLLKDVDYPDDYTLRVTQSQMEYWSPLAAVLLRSEREGEKEEIEPEPAANHDKKPKKVLPKRDELLKDPEVVKTVVLALETVDNMLKEKVTWTGPKALGIDYATPVESPHGPTDITEPYDMPDHDPAARQAEPKACWCGAERGEECKQGIGHNMEDCPKARPPDEDEKPEHLTVSQDSHDISSV